jgi:hypothetical protein
MLTVGFFFVSHCNRRHLSEGNSKGATIIVVFLLGLATNSTNLRKSFIGFEPNPFFLMRKLHACPDLNAAHEDPIAPPRLSKMWLAVWTSRIERSQFVVRHLARMKPTS